MSKGISLYPTTITGADTPSNVTGSAKAGDKFAMDVSDSSDGVGFLDGVVYDAVDVQQTSPIIDTYLFFEGGLAGTLNATITVTYTDECKTDIDTIVRT